MADVRRVYQLCGRCDGSGTIQDLEGGPGEPEQVDVECPICGGDKYVLWGWVTDAVFDSDEELENL